MPLDDGAGSATENEHAMTTKVAWAPDPPNNLGAVLATPGRLTMRAHLDLLADRVQAMLDEYEDREDVLRDVARELLDHDMQPDLGSPDFAGAEIVAALEGYLSGIGALVDTTIVPHEDDDGARDTIERQDLFDWLSQVLSSGTSG